MRSSNFSKNCLQNQKPSKNLYAALIKEVTTVL